MGKRSDFERIDKDFYRTIDPRAVASLSPFLSPETKYVEPCVGQGDLANELDKYGHTMVYGSDIKWGKDALRLSSEDWLIYDEPDLIITNPPWTRQILHPMIEHFSALKPTWLLFDADWAHTKQSSHYMKELCTDIVSVGRLIWIPGTKVQGKDSCCWYKFDINKGTNTRFHGR